MFDDASDRLRVVALFSPTCGTCLEGAAALQKLLQEFPGAPISIYVIWEPILAGDSAGPTRSALSRIPDSRAAQFWDPSHALSTHMGGPAGFGPRSGARILFDMDKYVWDFVAVYAPGFRWKGSSASPAFAGAPAVKMVDDVRAQIAAALRQ